jgi:hypothetical protein
VKEEGDRVGIIQSGVHSSSFFNNNERLISHVNGSEKERKRALTLVVYSDFSMIDEGTTNCIL